MQVAQPRNASVPVWFRFRPNQVRYPAKTQCAQRRSELVGTVIHEVARCKFLEPDGNIIRTQPVRCVSTGEPRASVANREPNDWEEPGSAHKH